MRPSNQNRIGRMLRRCVAAVPIVLMLTLFASAPTESRAAGLLIAEGGFGGVLEIQEHEVQVTINNGVAVTEVTQVFRNTENRQVEALYTFPVPKGASVANFSMWINGKEMVGEVIEKERAREIYNSYKRVRRDPGLLEQTDYKTFEMRIFPIAANAEQRVQIAYYQELDFDSDWATYVYPLATTTRAAMDSRTQGRFSLSFDVASEVPIVGVESPSHGDDFAVAKNTANYIQASLETTGGDLNRDVVLSFNTSRPVSGLDLVASKQPGEDGFALFTLTAGEELARQDDGMDYIFILDISGSMNDEGKLGVSRGSLDAFIGSLGAEDRFEVMTFNVAANPLFNDLRPAEAPAKVDAVRFLKQQKARGGTFLEPAIRAAYGYKDPDRTLNVVILSDGMTEQREHQTLLRLIGERPGSTRVFAIGVGNDVNRPLLQQLAEDAGGLAAFISRGDDFDRQAQAFRRKLMRPAITNLELDSNGVLAEIEPATLPNLYHGMPIRIYARYLQPGPATLILRGNIGGELFERAIKVELPGDEADNPEIERMWAWHRVQRLLKGADRDGSRTSVIPEIVELGEGFSIVTEYTSFLVLENDAEYQRWKIERRNATRIERDRAKQQRVRAELETLRNKAAAGIGPAGAEQPTREVAANRPPTNRQPAPVPTQQTQSNRGWDLDLGGGGGGALDPFSVGVVLALGGASFAARRRRKNGGA